MNRNATALLRTVAEGLTQPATEAEAKELLIRLLELRPAFGPWTPAVDALLREVGLYPYVTNPRALGATDLVAYEFHKPEGLENFVFHRAQAEVYRELIAGENVVLSAPTSFGKSAITHALIASGKYRNVVIVVPTLALIDETRRKMAQHAGHRIITQNTQRRGEKNIFVLTPERVNDREDLTNIDLFIIDEFYKLGTKLRSDDRSTTLNLAFYKLWKTGAQFYMLGPSIDSISSGFTESFHCKFLRLDYKTVVTDLIHLTVTEAEKEERLHRLCAEIGGPTIIYCSKPDSANALARSLLSRMPEKQSRELSDLADWLSEEYHPDWTLVKALQKGIGIHHGRTPRALAQAQVRLFDNGSLDFIICTPTLIEGVNTAAKNVIVWDHKLGGRDLDFFTFSNIKGRTGRMFRHFVGRVYVFEDPPAAENLEVDIPVHEQTGNTPLELLVQMDEAHLKTESLERVANIPEHPIVTLDFARRFKEIDPLALHSLADALQNAEGVAWRPMIWNTYPTKAQLQHVTNLIWEHLIPGRAGGGVLSAKHLSSAINQARRSQSLRKLINWRLMNFEGPTDDVIEDTLDQYRSWITFKFPRLLRVVDGIQREVARQEARRAGDYRFFASQLETFLIAPGLFALDEYGVPIQLAGKLARHFQPAQDVDEVLSRLRRVDPEALDLHPAERWMLKFAKEGLL